jgi:hypothetical protein
MVHQVVAQGRPVPDDRRHDGGHLWLTLDRDLDFVIHVAQWEGTGNGDGAHTLCMDGL